MSKQEIEEAQQAARELTERAQRVKETAQFYAATLRPNGPSPVKKPA